MQIFTTDYQNINNRFDCDYHKPEYVRLEKKLQDHNAVYLDTILESITNGVDYRKFCEEGQLKYLRVANIRPYKIDFSDTKKIALKKSDIIKNVFGKKDDILLTRKGTYGLSVSLEEDLDALISSEIFLLKLKTNKINSKYLSIFLNSSLGQRQFLRNKVGAIMGSLSQDAVKNTHVIIPSENEQQNIVKELSSAITNKKNKLKQADMILSSIDAYAKQQLDIDYNNTEEVKIYIVKSHILEDNRHDPYYHNPKYDKTINQVTKGKYPVETLEKYITEIRYGASVKNDYSDDGIPLLRILNLSPNKIDLTDVVQLPKNKSKAIGNCYVNKDDLLISRSGTIGVVAVVPQEADGFAFGSFMIKFKLNNEIDNDYVSIWLNSYISQLLIQRERIGAIQGNITIPTIKNFLIPIPPLNTQKTIAKAVSKKYNQVEKLQSDASGLLEEAKKKVEEMILN